MNKRLTSLILAVVMLLSLTVTAVPTFATGTDNGLSLSKEKASAGETFELYLKIPPITAGKSAANEFKIDYDKAVVKLTEFNPGCPSGASIGAYSTPDEANAAGQVGVNYNTAGGENLADWSEGLTYTFKFQVLDSAAVGNTKFEITTYTIVGYEEDGFTEIDYTPAGVVKEAILNITAAPKPATGISLNKSTLELTVGESETLVATVEPTDTTDTVTWTSSNTAVATVDTNGKVTAVATGTATITAKAGSQSATCVVTVTNAPCAHTNKSTVSAKDSTCTVKGWDEYKKCDDCGQLFDTSDVEIDEIPFRNLAKHTGGTATCQNKAVCATCNQPYGAFADHNYGELIAQVNPVHTPEGLTDGTAAHYKCSVCNELFNESKDEVTAADLVIPAAHTFGTEWEYNDTQHWHECACGAKEDIAAHSFQWIVDTPATEETTGLQHEECECGKTRSEKTVIPKLNHTHNWIETPAKPSTCVENGNNQYFYCTKCEKYFKSDKANETTVEAETLPLADHTPSATWSYDGTYHWKVCTVAGCGTVINETKAAHTPDREAATETDPIKCTECGYEIAPALGMSDYILEMPVMVGVKLTGDEKPGKETFKFEIYDLGVEDAEFEILNDTVVAENLTFDENGVAFIEGMLKIKVTGSAQLFNLTEGFKVRMVKGSAKGWTYATEQWNVTPVIFEGTTDADFNIGFDVREIVDGVESEIPANGMSFSVSYEAVTEPETPKTGDSSNMLLWAALLLAGGLGTFGTVAYNKKKKEDAE